MVISQNHGIYSNKKSKYKYSLAVYSEYPGIYNMIEKFYRRIRWGSHNKYFFFLRRGKRKSEFMEWIQEGVGQWNIQEQKCPSFPAQPWEIPKPLFMLQFLAFPNPSLSTFGNHKAPKPFFMLHFQLPKPFLPHSWEPWETPISIFMLYF